MRIKDLVIIAGIFLVGIGIPLAILYAALPFAASNVYVEPFLHMAVMAAIGLFAGILSFVMYRSWRYYHDPRLFIIALFLLINGIASVMHGGTGILWPNISIHLVLYLAAPLMLGVFLPQAMLQNLANRYYLRIIVGCAVLTIIAIPLLYLAIPETNSYRAETLTRIFIPPLGVLLWISALRLVVPRMIFAMTAPTSIVLWGTASLITAFYSMADSIWWYFHAVILFSMVILTAGVLKIRKEIGHIVAPFPLSSGIGTKLFFALLSLLFLFLLIAIVGYRIATRDISLQISAELHQVASTIEKRIEVGMDLIRERTSDFSSDWHLREATKKILAGDTNSKLELSMYLEGQKRILDPEHIRAVSILDTNNQILASTDASLFGTYVDERSLPALTAAKSAPYGKSSFDGPFRDPSIAYGAMHVFAPLYDLDRKTLLGVLYNKLSAYDIVGIFPEQNGDDHATFIVNADNMLITPFLPGRTAYVSKIDISPVRSCREENKNYTGAYTNDIGQRVNGVSKCLPDGWVIISEITEAQLSAGVIAVGRIIAVATILIGIYIMLLAYFITSTLVRPLQQIRGFASNLARGNLTSRITLQRSDELGKLAENLNAMADQLQKNINQLIAFDRTKSEFVSIASHQLGTPITALRWNLELLQDQIRSGKKKQIQQNITVLTQAAERMGKLVADLLNVSRIEQQKVVFEYERVDLCRLARTCGNELKQSAKDKSIKMMVACEKGIPALMLDSKRTREILMNLISNAIKFNKPKGSIRIEVRKKDEIAFITISDTGIGIPQQDQALIFSKFFRASNAASLEEGGTGLGLYIAKRYTEGQGGSIAFASTEGNGTTFTVSFPLKRELISGKPPPSSSHNEILIVAEASGSQEPTVSRPFASLLI